MKRGLFFGFILIYTITGVVGQNKSMDYIWKNAIPPITHYSNLDYKASPQNWDILQADNGLIYAANSSGVLEFDGLSWRKIQIPNGSPVSGLAKSEEGIIYVGSGDSELGFLKADSLGWLHYESLLSRLDTTYHKFSTLWNIYELDGAIYFIYAQYIFKWYNNEFTIWKPSKFFIGGFKVKNTIYIESLGEGLMRLDKDQLTLVMKEEREKRIGISMMLPYKDENWVIYRRHGELLLDENTGEISKSFLKENVLKDQLPYKGIQLRDGSYVITTLKNGVYHIDQNGTIISVFNKQSGLLANDVYNAFTDNDGSLWLATNNGIAKIEINAQIRKFDKTNGLEDPVERIVYHNDQLYAGTHNGVFSLALDSTRQTYEFRKFKKIEKTYGIVWDFCSTENGLLVVSGANFFNINADNNVEMIKFGGDGYNVIFKTSFDTSKIFVAGNKGYVYSTHFNNNKWLLGRPTFKIDGNINYTATDADGSLWLSTRFNGVYNINLYRENQKVDTIINQYGIAEGLPSISEMAVEFVKDKTYFSTKGGMYFFNNRRNKFEKDSVVLSFMGKRVEETGWISASNDGGMWFSATHDFKNRIFKYNNDEVVELISFRRFEDFQLNRINDMHQGLVFFNGPGGVLVYNSAISVNRQQTAPTRVRSVIIKGDSIVYGGAPESKLENFVFQADVNSIKFHFALPSYDSPDKNQFQYILKGLEEGWSKWTNDSYKEYTNLMEGDYQFRVRAKNIYGQISEEDTYSFSIAPPWYRSWWAYFFYTLFGFVLLSVVSRLRSRQLIKEKEALEITIKHRTEDIRLMNDKLQKQTTKLQAQTNKLKEIDIQKSRLFANISHEFRTPLTLIKGPIDELEKKPHQGLTNSNVNMIQRNTDRLLRLVNQLLDLSKLDAGSLGLELTEGDIYKCLRAASSSFSSHAAQRHMDYQIRIPTEVLWASFDRDKLEKIAYNLLSNAFKFTPDEGTISVRAQYEEGKFKITVADNGKGITKEKIQNIFDRFYQVDDSQTREQEGTGIGLALTHELVELMGGSIQVESEITKGCTLYVAIPIEPIETADYSSIYDKKALKSEGIYNSDSDSKANDQEQLDAQNVVLVVEDNADMRDFIRQQLVEDYKVLEAVNGKMGIEKATAAIPDLIITDLMMPQLDGIKLAENLKNDQRTSHIPIIMLTAKAGLENKIEGLNTGADYYLTKPFESRELQTMIRSLIKQRQILRKQFGKEIKLQPKNVLITSLDEQFLQKIKALYEEHLDDEQFNVIGIQEELGMSKTQLHRKMKALTDQTPGTFLRNYRLQRAAQILSQKGENITQVAYAVGFGNPSYFAKCFKEYHGMLPSEFRK